MNAKKLLTNSPAIVGASFGLLMLFEFCTVHDHYELESATVRQVVPDARGFIGAEEMTLVRFADGFDTEVAGNRGAPGDKILAYRRRGTLSLFGILGDARIKLGGPK